MKIIKKETCTSHARKLERLFEIVNNLKISDFSSLNKKVIFDSMTLDHQLYRKRTSHNEVVKNYNSKKIQIIFNLETEEFEFAGHGFQSPNPKVEEAISPRFDFTKLETTHERVLLLTYDLESLISKLSPDELDEIFFKDKLKQHSRDYLERRTLGFKNKKGFDKLLELIIQKIKRIYKRNYLGFMKGKVCESIPSYFSDFQMEQFAIMTNIVSEQYTQPELLVDNLPFYLFVEQHKELEVLKEFLENKIFDSIEADINPEFSPAGNCYLTRRLFIQLFSVAGPQRSFEFLKDKLDYFYNNLTELNFNESKKTLESLYNASQFFYDSVSGFNGKNFGELYQFMADKLQQLQEFKAQGNNCFIFNSINFDNFIENTPKPTEVLIYYNGYNRDFSDFELKQLLCRDYTVKVRLFKNDQFSFDTVIESLIDLHDFMKSNNKNDYKLLLCKAELDSIKLLEFLISADNLSEAKDAIDLFENSTY